MFLLALIIIFLSFIINLNFSLFKAFDLCVLCYISKALPYLRRVHFKYIRFTMIIIGAAVMRQIPTTSPSEKQRRGLVASTSMMY